MSARIVGIAVAANESDIVEAFVRHNLQYLDALHVIDKCSVDDTLVILECLRDEGLPLSFHQDPIADHDHPRVMTSLARSIARADRAEFIAMLDCDEMISSVSRETFIAELSGMPDGVCGVLPWRTYMPNRADRQSEPCVTRRITHRMANESVAYGKAVVPCRLILDEAVSVSMGNHGVQRDGEAIAEQWLKGTALAHYPVRSIEQIVSKAFLGDWTLRQKLRRGLNEGLSWRNLASEIRANPPRDHEALCSLATRYLGSAGPVLAEPLPQSDYPLRYGDPSRIDLTVRIAAFSDAFFSHYEKEAVRNGDLSVGRAAWGLFATPDDAGEVGQAFRTFGEWQPDALALLRALVKPGYQIVDIGAGYGEFSLPLADMTGASGSVMACERSPDLVQYCVTNAVLNRKTWLHVHPLPVDAREAAALVPARADLIRIAPGWDVPLIAGLLSGVLQGAKPYVFVHVVSREAGVAILAALSLAGYECWWHAEPAFNPQNYFRVEVKDVRKRDVPKLALLGVHQSLRFDMPGLERA